ncbi:MAG: PD-(D/E)XK nuclease family protein, partial [Bacteroidetes bacterium]|nr:PD-(D/E)XK nuclease family protein [Bacteroidota bacterium]
MLTFLEETLNSINKNHVDISSLTIILPSKRAGGFLLNYLKRDTSKTSFAPTIISIEEFIEELSGLKIINSTELLFKSYKAYINTPSKQEKDEFDVYSTWANTLLNDFNEIDRHLIPPDPFFNYLSSIQDINHWYLKSEKTKLIENYLAFWDSLQDFYDTLFESLSKDNLGYQGMVYREAAENIEHYNINNAKKKHVFIGFNALNNAEQTIIQELLETGNAEIYWDTDVHFYNDKKHSASYFIRKYASEWKFFKNQAPKFVSNNFNNEKTFTIVEAQKNIGQAKFIGQYLSNLSKNELNKTAIILADENLLQPVLQSLPSNIDSLNITMGVSLKSFPTITFFELLLFLHINSGKEFYYKNILAILNHPLASKLLSNTKGIINSISKENITHISYSRLLKLNQNKETEILQILFGNWENKSENALSSCLKILLHLKTIKKTSKLDRVVYYNLFSVFQNIEKLNTKFEYLKTVKTVQNLFAELISTTTLDFKGDAYNGLQIMGVLESRVLDFENILIASVNEGTFPSGKSNASFITYDLKNQFGLPTYTEKDAIYTYHFYRLLHRAKNITLLYNNFSDGLNTGEKSRFISQLEIENIPNHTIQKSIINPAISISESKLKTVNKTADVINRLKEIANYGFSPSALTSYLRNPIEFYYQKILKINEFKEVEETVAANTLGTIVHDTLEIFYKPFENNFLTVDILLKMQQEIEKEVATQFKKTFKEGSFSKGKNLLIFEVAKRFVFNFTNYE